MKQTLLIINKPNGRIIIPKKEKEPPSGNPPNQATTPSNRFGHLQNQRRTDIDSPSPQGPGTRLLQTHRYCPILQQRNPIRKSNTNSNTGTKMQKIGSFYCHQEF